MAATAAGESLATALAAAEAALPDLVLTVKPTQPCREARNVLTGEHYPMRDGEFTVSLPKTTWLMVELSPDAGRTTAK